MINKGSHSIGTQTDCCLADAQSESSVELSVNANIQPDLLDQPPALEAENELAEGLKMVFKLAVPQEEGADWKIPN